MYLPCTEAAAIFSAEGLKLSLPVPGQILLDCHHGDIFVLRASGLAAGDFPAEGQEDGIRLELTLSPPATILAGCEGFAAHQQLPVGSDRGAAGELLERPVLTACHVPGANLFVYTETSTFTARVLSPDRVEIVVTGEFKTRKIPCREVDLVIHLERPAAARLLTFLANLTRARL